MIDLFIPEAHDIGKMVDNDAVIRDALTRSDSPLVISDNAIKTAQETKHVGGHTFEWVDWEHINWNSDPFKGLKDNPNFKMIRLEHPSDRREREKYAKLPQEAIPDIRFRKQILLMKMADHYASTFSRVVAEGDQETRVKFEALRKVISPERKRMVLWRKKSSDEPTVISTVEQFLDLLTTLKEPGLTSGVLLKKYDSRLQFLPEDASAPRNVTSLLTHLTLVGNIYRFLAEFYANALQEDTVFSLDKESRVKDIEHAEGSKDGKTPARWLMTLTMCHLRVPQQPVRIGDLNAFRLQEQVLSSIRQTFKNQILFYTNDTLWLMLPSSNEVDPRNQHETLMKNLRETLTTLVNEGFWAEVRSLEEIKIRPTHPEVRRLRWQNDQDVRQDEQVKEMSVYANLADSFEPRICSICQMREATKQWPRDSKDLNVRRREDTPEDLCEICIEIRDVPEEERFKKLASWHREDDVQRNIKTAWVKLTLDYDALIEYLGDSFDGYLDSLRTRIPADNTPAQQALVVAHEEFNPLALMADFTEDYRRMTQAIHNRLENEHWEFESIREKDFRDLYVIKVESGKAVLEFLKLYREELVRWFPDALSPCPIQIAVNVSLTEYPFYEHWRWISSPMHEVNLQMPGIARVEINAKEFVKFLDELDLTAPKDGRTRLTKTYLERLRATEARTGRSRALLTAVLLSDIESKRIPQTLQPFIELFQQKKIIIQDILDWYKISTWGT